MDKRQAIFDSLPENLCPPKNCPTCGTVLVLQDAWPFCPNWDCAQRVYGRMQKFVDVLDLKGAGIETLRGLVFKGIVKTPADLFKVTLDQFCLLDRKGEKHYEKLRQGLEVARRLLPAQIFASLDIEGIGTWESICAVPGLQSPEQILKAAEDNNLELFSRAVRVSANKAGGIVEELLDRKSEILALLAEIRVKETGKKLLGRTFCITGSLSSGSRSKVESAIKEAGGQVTSSVTSRTTHLVCNDTSSASSKVKKARSLGIPLITEEQLLKMLLD